jgi:hypothetical protein
MVGVGEHLRGLLRGSVGRDGRVDGEGLDERHRLPGVERRGRGDDDLARAGEPHRLEDVEGAEAVRRHVNPWILHAVAHAAAAGEVQHGVERAVAQQIANRGAILDIDLLEVEVLMGDQPIQPGLLESHVVGIVEAVDPGYGDAPFQEHGGGARGDKSGNAGDEETSHESV